MGSNDFRFKARKVLMTYSRASGDFASCARTRMTAQLLETVIVLHVNDRFGDAKLDCQTIHIIHCVSVS